MAPGEKVPKAYKPPMQDSKILSKTMAMSVGALISKEAEFKKLYLASEEGWSVKEYGDKVWKQGPAVTIVKTTGGAIFGGYTDISWY